MLNQWLTRDWNAAVPPKQTRTADASRKLEGIKNMSLVALNLRGLPPVLIIQQCTNHKTGITNNPAVFATPSPTMAAYGTLIATAQTKVTAADAAAKAASAAILDRDNALAALMASAGTLGSYVQETTLGDPVKIALANMAVKGTPTPGGQLGQVQHLSVTAGDTVGSLDYMWDGLRGRSTFELQTCTGDPTVEANWKFAASCRGSRKSLKGQVSGTRVYGRVRAVAPKEEHNGDWSEMVSKIVP